MIRLHARDHAERCEARDVRRAQMLRVLDAEAPVARTVLANHALVDVELRSDRAVADRVDDHVQPARRPRA